VEPCMAETNREPPKDTPTPSMWKGCIKDVVLGLKHQHELKVAGDAEGKCHRNEPDR